MLVLSRKKQQQIIIGEQFVVTVLEVRGNGVKLGLAGPLDIPIRRGELKPSARPSAPGVTLSTPPVVPSVIQAPV